MFDFLKIEPESFGIDVSDLSLKIAKLKRKKNFYTLSSWGKTSLEPGVIEEGKVRDKDIFIKEIKKAIQNVKGEKLKENNVIVSLPERKSFFQIIRMPKMSKKELETAVLFEAENYIPFAINDVYLDFQILPEDKNRFFANSKSHFRQEEKTQDILISAFPRDIIDDYLECFKGAGLVVQAMEVESQSIVRALIRNEVSPFPIFIIDFGRSTTSFILFSGYSICFTSSIPLSSHSITERIAELLKIDLKEAEKLKRKYGLDLSGKHKRSQKLKKIFQATEEILSDLVKEIKKYFLYYQTHINQIGPLPKEKEIKKVILCGRGANLKGLTTYLSLELGILTELGNPWINILPQPLKEIPQISYEESLGYVTALGLALRGVKPEEDVL